jgi:hypothetical protein
MESKKASGESDGLSPYEGARSNARRHWQRVDHSAQRGPLTRRRGFGLLDQPDSINALYGHRLRGCHERLKNLK